MNRLTYELGTLTWQPYLVKRISQHTPNAGLPQTYLGLEAQGSVDENRV